MFFFSVAAQAEPKKAIFDHLVDVLPAGTKLSYRIYEKGLRLLLDTAPKPPVNNTVVFLNIK
jgi:hypothetical protein